MSNIIISPQSGVIEFNTGNAGSGSFMTSTAPIRLDATGGNVWFTGSNVGIGTTTPATKLHINGPSAGFSEALRLQRDGGNYYSIGLDNGDLNFCYNGQSADGSLLVLDGAADGVGIGTKSPATLLDVDGAVNHGIRIGSNNALIGEGGSTGTQLIFWNGDSAFYGRSAAPFNHSVSNHFFRVGGNDIAMIGSAGVGIGTASPAYDLHVHKANTTGPTIELSNSEYRTYINAWGSTATAGRANRFEINAGETDFAVGADTIRFQIGNVGDSNEKMRIASDGKVGIGVTDPDNPLEVSGADNGIKIYSASSDRPRLTLDCGGTDKLILSSNSTYGAIGDSTDTNRYMVFNGGKVGLGTTTPAHQLHLNKEDAIGEMQISRGGSDPSTNTDIGRIQFKTDYSASPNEVGSIWVRTNSSAYRTDMRLGVKATAGSEEVGLTIHGTNDGPLVGIGTTDPSYQLDVKGDRILLDRGGTNDAVIEAKTATAGAYFFANSYGTGNYAGLLIQGGGADNWFLGQYGYADFRIVDGSRGGGTAALTIQNTTRNVGIGTVTPTTTLQVAGTISGATISGVNGQFSEGLFISGAPVLTGENNPAEADTLATVTARGNTTTTSIVSTGPHISGATGLFGQGTFTRADIGSVDIFGDAIYVGEVRTNSLSDKASNGNAQINFGGSSKTIEFETDATARMFIAANGNVGVGIGSSAANQKFTVGARSNFDSANNYYGSWVDGNTAGDSFFAVGQWYNVGGRMQAGSNNMYIHTHNTSHDLVLQSGGGYVGIETNTPAKQLQLGGSNPWLRLEESDSGGNKRLDLWVEGSTGVIGANQSAQTMMFQTVGDTKMTITSAGRIGIGTKSPTSSSLLHVTGDVYVGDGTATAMGRNFQAYSAGFGIVRNSVATLVAKSAVASNTTNNSLLTTNYSTDGVLWYKQSYSQGHTWHRTTGYTVGATISESEGELMRLTTGGKVGIGTNDPLGTTHIYTADAGGTIATNASHDDLIIENNGNCGIQLSSPASSYQYLAFGDTASANQGYVRYYHSSDRMDLRAGGSDILSLVGSKVGIGTTNPQEELDLRGDMRLDSGGTTDRSIYFRNQSSIAKVRSDAALQFDVGVSSSPSAAMYIEEDTRHVGIGTTNPHSLLEVSNNSNDATLIVSSKTNATNGSYLRLIEAGTAFDTYGYLGGYIQYDCDDNLINIGRHNVNGTTLSDDAPAISIKRSDGNVGIGTTSPSQQLEVAGQTIIDGGVGVNSSATLHLRQKGDTANDGLAITSSHATSHRIWKNGAGTLNIGPSTDTDAFVQDLDGNVGIGSNSPAVELDVVGTGDFDSVRILNSSASLNPRLILGRNANENIQFSVQDQDCTIRADQDSDSDANHKFILNRTFAGAGENDFQIAKDGTAQVTVDTDGNVGIGTNNPGAALDIHTATNTNGILIREDTDDSITHNMYVSSSDNGVMVMYANGQSSKIQLNTAGDSYFNGGDVGIGTDSPDEKLHVVGDVLIDAGSTNTNTGELGFTTQYDTAFLRSSYTDPSASTETYLAFHANTAGEGNGTVAEQMRIAGNKVGIGTDDPPQKLSVKGTIVHLNNSNIQVAGMTNSSSAGRLYANNAGGVTKVLLDSNGSSYLDGGNVGIGTNDPKTILDIDGAANHGIRLGINNALIGEGSSTTGTQLLFWNGTAAYYGRNSAPFTHTVSHHFFRAGGSDKMTITTSGVGINKTSPAADLNVDGRVKIEGTSYHTWINFGSDEDTYIRGGKAGSEVFINDTHNSNVLIAGGGGNVGIGTTNPVQKLQANGSIYSYGGHFYVDNDKSLTSVGDLRLKTNNGTTAVFIDTSQNVGIGTTSPAKTLTVDGTIGGTAFGIADGKGLLVDGSPSDDQYARFTANGLEGRSVANLLSDLSLDSELQNLSSAEIDYLEAIYATDVTSTEFDYLDGVTSNIQTQLNNRYTESEMQTIMEHSYISKEGANDLAVGWYTIATNTGNRAVARFGIWDTDSSRHQSVIFYAAHKYGNASADTITVLDTSHYGTSPFRYIRIKAGGTYDGAALQVYIDNSQNALNAAILGDNFQSDSWVLCDFIPDADTPPLVSNYGSFTESSRIDLDEIAQGGFATTGPIYADGNTTQYKVITTNDFGISDTDPVKIDSSSVADNEYARFTANGLESRSTSEVRSDIGAQATLTFGIANTNAVKIDDADAADNDYAKFTSNGLEGRSASEVRSDISAMPSAGNSSTEVQFATVTTPVIAFGSLAYYSPTAGKRAFTQLSTDYNYYSIGSTVNSFSAGSTCVPIYGDGSYWRVG